jgi:hypothetical protein
MFKKFTKTNMYLLILIFTSFNLKSTAQTSTIDSRVSTTSTSSSSIKPPSNTSTIQGNLITNTRVTSRTNDRDDNSRLRSENKIVTKYIFPEFKRATLFYKDSTIAKNIFVNIKSPNRYEIHLKNKGIIDMSSLIRVVFEKGSTEKDFIIFQNGYKGETQHDEDLLYQVLASGKMDLLLKKYSVIEDKLIYNVIEGEGISNYSDILYVYLNNHLERVKFNKNFFFDKFDKEKQGIMEEYVILNKVNFKKTDDIIKLIKFYNNLAD